MAMFIKWEGGIQELHIPGDKPMANASDVIEVQADGDELEEIKIQFGFSVPQGHARVQRWFGDIAKSIVANLKF